MLVARLVVKGMATDFTSAVKSAPALFKRLEPPAVGAMVTPPKEEVLIAWEKARKTLVMFEATPLAPPDGKDPKKLGGVTGAMLKPDWGEKLIA